MTVPFIGPDMGGPSSLIVHQDRLVMAGSGAVSDLLMASRTGVWTDFRLGLVTKQGATESTPVTDVASQVAVGDSFVAAATDGFYFQQTSGRGNEFHALLQQEGLFVLGSLGESIIPPNERFGFTAQGIEIRENSWHGSELGRTPLITSGLVVFIEKGGQDLRAIAWNEGQRKYIAAPLLALSGRVFREARDLTSQPARDGYGDTVFVIDEDGGLAVLLLRPGEGAAAWSTWDTEGGHVLAATAPLGTSVFAVERGGVVALETLERATADEDFDVWATLVNEDEVEAGQRIENALGPARTALLMGEDALTWSFTATGETERRRGEGDWNALLRDISTIDGDTFQPTGEMRGGLRCEIGRPYSREVETLPFVRQGASGMARSVRKVRILECAVDYVLIRPQPGDSQAEEDEHAALVANAGGAEMVVVAERNRRVRLSPARSKDVKQDNRSIGRVHYKTGGWRDRIALKLTSDRHIEIAGISYKAIG